LIFELALQQFSAIALPVIRYRKCDPAVNYTFQWAAGRPCDGYLPLDPTLCLQLQKNTTDINIDSASHRSHHHIAIPPTHRQSL